MLARSFHKQQSIFSFLSTLQVLSSAVTFVTSLMNELSSVERSTASVPDPHQTAPVDMGDPGIHPRFHSHYSRRNVQGDGHCCLRAVSLCLFGMKTITFFFVWQVLKSCCNHQITGNKCLPDTKQSKLSSIGPVDVSTTLTEKGTMSDLHQNTGDRTSI